MKVETFRFGAIEVRDEEVVNFPEGIVGLTHLKRFVLFCDPNSADLIWMQAVDQASFMLALVHAPKLGLVARVEIPAEELAPLRLDDPADLEIFFILNRVEGQPTVNLRGPIVVNAEAMVGRQVVLSKPELDVRHPLQVAPPPEPPSD